MSTTPAALPTTDQLLSNIKRLLTLVAEESRPCTKCGAQLWMVRHKNGKLAPYTAAGLNHFADCKFAGEFRKAAARD